MDTAFIGKRITELRLKHDISEHQMSLELGKGKSYIQTITAGKALPSVKQLFNICDYFDISLAEFFDEKTSDPEMIHRMITHAKGISPKDLELLEAFAKRLALGEHS